MTKRDEQRGHEATADEQLCEQLLDEWCDRGTERSWWYREGKSELREVEVDPFADCGSAVHEDIFEAAWNYAGCFDRREARSRTIAELKSRFRCATSKNQLNPSWYERIGQTGETSV